MDTQSANRASIQWLVLEGIAVVLSILLAFTIDAWWQNLQRKDDEQIILQSLHDDLVEKRKLVDYNIEYTKAILDSTKLLINAATDSDLKSNPEKIDRLLGDTWWYHDPSEWNSAPLNSLISGGDISSISNARLLQKLSLLQVRFDALSNQYKNDENFLHNVYVPFLISKIDLAQIANAHEHSPGHPESAYVFPDLLVSDRYDHSKVLSDIELRNMLVVRLDRLIDISVFGYAGVADQLDEAIMLIGHELED